jgi:hypothetical protein
MASPVMDAHNWSSPVKTPFTKMKAKLDQPKEGHLLYSLDLVNNPMMLPGNYGIVITGDGLHLHGRLKIL